MLDRLDVNLICGFIGALLGACFGEINGLFVALIIFMIMDYVSGIMCAIYNKRLSSNIGFKGLIKKAAILVVVIIGNTVDVFILQNNGNVCRNMVVMFYLSNEGISILENYNKMNLPFPAKLRKILLQLTQPSDDDKI